MLGRKEAETNFCVYCDNFVTLCNGLPQQSPGFSALLRTKVLVIHLWVTLT